MAPTDKDTVEQQTTEIVRCLFGDVSRVQLESFDDCLEVDGPGSTPFRNESEKRIPRRGVAVAMAASYPVDMQQFAHRSDDFDPVQIADKLRDIADGFSEDIAFQAALKELKSAVAKEAAEAAISHGVEAVCQAQVSQRAEVAPEMQIIKASVAFGLYVTKSAPELKNTLQNAMSSFLNRRVGTWVAQQGGWGRV